MNAPVYRAMPLDLISVHVPKCAGVSVSRILERSRGVGSVYLDYGDRPLDPESPMNKDRAGFFERFGRSGFEFLAGKRAVHGHFHPAKYDGLRARNRITFLREPVDRLLSHYFFWKALPRHGHSLHDHMLDKDLTVEQFASLPQIRSIYTAVFFSGVNMARFDFIGFHDRLADDARMVGRLLGSDEPMSLANANIHPSYCESRHLIASDSARMGRLRDALRDDVMFYDTLRAKA